MGCWGMKIFRLAESMLEASGYRGFGTPEASASKTPKR